MEKVSATSQNFSGSQESKRDNNTHPSVVEQQTREILLKIYPSQLASTESGRLLKPKSVGKKTPPPASKKNYTTTTLCASFHRKKKKPSERRRRSNYTGLRYPACLPTFDLLTFRIVPVCCCCRCWTYRTAFSRL